MTSRQAVLVGIGMPRRAGRWATLRLIPVVRSFRGRHLFLIDLLAIATSICLALELRGDTAVGAALASSYGVPVLIPLAVRPFVNERLGLGRRLWAHASVPELVQVVWAVLAGSVISVGLATVLSLGTGVALRQLPASFWVLELIFSLVFIGGLRFGLRALNDVGTRAVVGGATISLTPALLYGAGRAGVMTARSAKREPAAGVKPVGFLDGDPVKRGSTVAGLPVFGGLDRLADAVRRTGARMLLITLPNPSGDMIRRIMREAEVVGLQVRTVPPMRGLFDGTWQAGRVRDIRLEDLLTREQVTIHADGVADVIRDQVVMVTGAGGSIGSELARQIYAFGPSKLVLVDRAESPLYMIQRELELRKLSGRGDGELSIHLANVASKAVMTRLIARTRPSAIFHAAACKHVPMMEEHPSESVQVNVGGTMAVLSAAIAADVSRFVLVSTDKAVEPSSVMGATKRLAEWLVADAAQQTGRSYVAVRFGNVLGSAGSVLPIFQSQLENGEAITITHPDMTRYFMTMPEAGWLILDAAAIGRPGDLFVLDMGKPVRIVDMARDLIRLAGRSQADVPIRFTGLRPGEKLHERLFYDTEMVVHTEVDKILRVADAAPPPDVIERARRLLEMALGDRDHELREALFDLVSTSSPMAPEDATAGGVEVPAANGNGRDRHPDRMAPDPAPPGQRGSAVVATARAGRAGDAEVVTTID